MKESDGSTRRTILRLGIAAPVALLGLFVVKPADAQMKISKSLAGYRPRPNGDQHCGNCRFFIPDKNRCRLVAGRIEANSWCERWAPRAG